MDHVVVLLEADRSGIQQIFGPYGTEHLAHAAKDELSRWPTLRGQWEVRPLTRHGDTGPTRTPPLPALPYVPPHTHPEPYPNPGLWPSPAWPYRDSIVWCGPAQGMALTADQAYANAFPGAGQSWTGTVTFNAGKRYELNPDEGDDGAAGVPARV